MATEKSRMRTELRRLLAILREHPGRDKAISLIELYEKFSGRKLERNDKGRIIEDVPTESRYMRRLINELIEVHSIPVMSSSGAGYWIITDKAELEGVVHEFTSRGISSLAKVARLKECSLVDAVQQLALELEDEESAARKRAETVAARLNKGFTIDGSLLMSREAKMAVITKYLQELFSSPDDYADQIEALRIQFGPRLVPQSVLAEISRQSQSVKQMAADVIAVAEKLQEMVSQ
ncbi:MAG TPA: hypothetical protein ENJ18_05220 [Nannocystis exedens]|nr:hypothetical protein [Nannocystis exedens]